ncbi:MAG: glucose-1-phosphate adenylyltransferase [Acidobacteria bacterium]|nr:glucose-1-phosphate adenylyltransferase [Acidobacteriota bacterium]
MQGVIGVILGGGQGRRLYPLTKMRSKPAVPLGGKYRLIDIPISNCLNSGINRVFVLTQFNSASLNKHIMQTYKFDMFSGGFVDILAAEQTPDNANWFQGTADAVRQSVKHLLPYSDVKSVVILSGDQLYQMDLLPVVDFHEQNGADITVAAVSADAQTAPRMGVMKLEKNGRISAFVEKPKPEELAGWDSLNRDDGRNFLGSMGIYVFRKDLLIDILTKSDAADFGMEIIPKAISRHRVFAWPFEGYWEDIGTIRSFYEANLALTEVTPQFNFYNAQRPVYTNRRNLPASKLNNCAIHQAIISEGSVLSGADIKHSIIGVRTRVGSGTTIQHSVVMGADYFETVDQMAQNVSLGRPNIGIGSNCTIINAIVDKNVRIGDNVSIINAHNMREKDDENYFIRDGIIVVPKDAWIRSGTVI